MKLNPTLILSSAVSFLAGLIVCWNLKASVDRQDISEIKIRLDASAREGSIANHDTKRILDKVEQCQVLLTASNADLKLSIDRAVQAIQGAAPVDPSVVATPEEIQAQDARTRAGAKKN